MHDFSGMADAGGMGYPPSPLIGPWPRVFGCGAGVFTPNLNPEERSRFGHPSREGLKTTVTKALEHNVRTSDGMNWNLHDLVYEALSEEWGRRDGEISDLWADDGPSGYQPPSYEPVNPERRTPQTPSDGLI